MNTRKAADKHESILTVRPGKLADLTSLYLEADVPLYIEGPGGIGKSAIVRQVAEAMGYEVIDLRLTLLNPVDLRGCPVPVKADNGDLVVVWYVPKFLPRNDGKKYLIFLDELPQALPSLQVASFQLLWDRRCGEYICPPGVRFAAAGNGILDTALVFELPMPLRSRLAHLILKPDFEDWKAGFALQRGVDHRIISYLEARPENFCRIDPDVFTHSHPCPRTWDLLDRVIKRADRRPGGLPWPDFKIVSASLVGDGPGQEFSTHCQMDTAYSSAEGVVVKGDLTISPPVKLSERYAFCGAMVHYATAGDGGVERQRRARNLFGYAARAALGNEFAVLVGKDYARTPQGKDAMKEVSPLAEWKEYYGKYRESILWWKE